MGFKSLVLSVGTSSLALASTSNDNYYTLLYFSSLSSGLSMFYWCWISVDTDLSQFVALSFFLYYLPHFVIWVFSTAVLVFVISIFWGGRLSASSETRTFVMKQNGIYVLVLGIETSIILPLWIAQLSILGHGKNSGPVLYFYTKTSFALAVTLAVVHSLRGAIDLFVWCLTFSIGPADFKLMYNQMRQKFARGPTPAVRDIDVPLLTADTVVNKALRRDTMYCINVGILDAVMLDTDLENRQLETEERYSNPFYREQSERKITFPSSASIQSFAFVDIEPAIFHLLRAAYGISSADYRQSFKLQNAADVESSRMLEKFTEGKSGSFFYFSHDFHYIIKTVTAEEEKFLRRVAYYYYKHMKQNPSSLIVRFYGLHKVRLAPEQRYITVVVMENIFSKFDQLRIDHTYDLKGSTLGRRSLKRGQTRESYRGTMKDLDLDHPIVIGPDNKARLMKQLRRDVAFLTHCGIMDYSLLIGIHKITSGDDGQCDPEPNTPWFRQDKGGLRSYSPFHPCSIYEQQKSGRDTFRGMTEYQGTNVNDLPIATYFFGIVDVLQEYNLRKKAEHILKTRFLCRNRHKVSVVNQQEYGERFLKAMDKIFQ